MRAIILLRWTGVAVLAPIAGTVAGFYSIDVDGCRDEIAAEFRKATRRELVIAAEIGPSVSLRSAIVVEKAAAGRKGCGEARPPASPERPSGSWRKAWKGW